MEYLTTYGWSILIIAVVIVAMYALGIFNPTSNAVTNACLSQSGFLCSRPVMNTTGTVTMSLGQDSGMSYTVNALGCTNQSSVPPTTFVPISPVTIGNGQILTMSFKCPLANQVLGSGFSGALWMQYTTGTYGGGGQVKIGLVSVKATSSSALGTNFCNPSNFAVYNTITTSSSTYGAGIMNPTGTYFYEVGSNPHTIYVIATSNNMVVNTINIGAQPSSAAMTPNGAYIYAASEAGGTVSVIATSNDMVMNTITVGSEPIFASILPSGNYAYVANYGSDTVSVIATSNNMVVNTINNIGTSPYTFSQAIPPTSAMTPSGSYLYVPNPNSGTVSVIATSNDMVMNTITVGTSPTFASITPSGSYVYVSNEYGTFTPGTISVIATSNNMVVNTITVGDNPDAATFTSSGAYAYVSNYASSSVSVIATSNNMVVNTITVGYEPQPTFLTPSGAYAYVSDPLPPAGYIYIIATANDTVVKSFNLYGFPGYPASTPTGSYIYVMGTNPGVAVLSNYGC